MIQTNFLDSLNVVEKCFIFPNMWYSLRIRRDSVVPMMKTKVQEVASSNVKVLVVANPANTNCLVALTEASRIPTKNFCALTYLDHQRAKGQIASRLGVPANCIKNVTIWGNHSETQYPDAVGVVWLRMEQRYH